jgi:hypothetical protein
MHLRQKEIGDHAVCVCDSEWWLVVIKEHSEEHKDLKINFFLPPGPLTSFSLCSNNQVWAPQTKIV